VTTVHGPPQPRPSPSICPSSNSKRRYIFIRILWFTLVSFIIYGVDSQNRFLKRYMCTPGQQQQESMRISWGEDIWEHALPAAAVQSISFQASQKVYICKVDLKAVSEMEKYLTVHTHVCCYCTYLCIHIPLLISSTLLWTHNITYIVGRLEDRLFLIVYAVMAWSSSETQLKYLYFELEGNVRRAKDPSRSRTIRIKNGKTGVLPSSVALISHKMILRSVSASFSSI
jgi:hypothetical protein